MAGYSDLSEIETVEASGSSVIETARCSACKLAGGGQLGSVQIAGTLLKEVWSLYASNILLNEPELRMKLVIYRGGQGIGSW